MNRRSWQRSAAERRSWLLTDTPWSRLQAEVGQLYRSSVLLVQNRLALLGLLIGLALVAAALLAPWLALQPPEAQDLGLRLQPPGATWWFGTDELGRDIYSRILFGSRITLGIGALVVVLVGPLGLLIGCSAGYFGGWVDTVLMRFTDVFLTFPRLILALAFVAALGPGITHAVIAITLTAWPPYARAARAETLALRDADFVNAARLQGAGPIRIVLVQIVPLCLSSMIVRLTLDMSGVIVTAAGFGFLGLGAQPPSPEWGAMISSGRRFILDQWWVAFFPGLAICLAGLGFNLLGDGLRDVLEPKQR
jgi:peptide/nickel transport system permease protein